LHLVVVVKDLLELPLVLLRERHRLPHAHMNDTQTNRITA
jgi:hypothetical protein